VTIYSIPGGFSRSILNAFLGVLLTLFLSAGVTSAEPFDPDHKSKLEAEASQVGETANYWAKFNQTWDITFKVLISVLGILSAVGAALAGTVWKNSTPLWLTIVSVMVGAAITGLTAFASTQINFPARAETYQRKYTTLQGLDLDLRFSNPEKTPFLAALTIVYKWDDSNAPSPGDIQEVQKLERQAQGVQAK
jgi:hypothetical protein